MALCIALSELGSKVKFESIRTQDIFRERIARHCLPEKLLTATIAARIGDDPVFELRTGREPVMLCRAVGLTTDAVSLV